MTVIDKIANLFIVYFFNVNTKCVSIHETINT